MSERPDPTARPIPDTELASAIELIRTQRWANLATLDADGSPRGAMVAYVPDTTLCRLHIHVSTLALHTCNLLERHRFALTIAEPDTGEGDPQTLARITLQGQATVLTRGGEHYQATKARYLERLPEAELVFGFDDFVMFELDSQHAHYVGGFARAYHFDAAKLRTDGSAVD